VWNSLPESVVFTSLTASKRSIRTVDFSQFLNVIVINKMGRCSPAHVVVFSIVFCLDVLEQMNKKNKIHDKMQKNFTIFSQL